MQGFIEVIQKGWCVWVFYFSLHAACSLCVVVYVNNSAEAFVPTNGKHTKTNEPTRKFNKTRRNKTGQRYSLLPLRYSTHDFPKAKELSTTACPSLFFFISKQKDSWHRLHLLAAVSYALPLPLPIPLLLLLLST